MRNPVVGVARAGSAASTREARTPQAWSRYEPPRTARQPSSSARVGDPLPHVAGQLLGAARARRPRDGRGPARSSPSPASAQAQRSGSKVDAPRPRPPVGPAGRRLPLGAGRQARAGPRAERERLGERDLGRGVVGELRGVEPRAQRRAHGAAGLLDERPDVRVDDGPAADQDRPERDVALLPRLAEAVDGGGDLDERVEGRHGAVGRGARADGRRRRRSERRAGRGREPGHAGPEEQVGRRGPSFVADTSRGVSLVARSRRAQGERSPLVRCIVMPELPEVERARALIARTRPGPPDRRRRRHRHLRLPPARARARSPTRSSAARSSAPSAAGSRCGARRGRRPGARHPPRHGGADRRRRRRGRRPARRRRSTATAGTASRSRSRTAAR